jgi:hypothetical protein
MKNEKHYGKPPILDTTCCYKRTKTTYKQVVSTPHTRTQHQLDIQMLEEDMQHKKDNVTATKGENFKEYETYQQWLSKTTQTRNQSEERELPRKEKPKEREDEHHQGYPAQGYPAQGYPAQGYPARNHIGGEKLKLLSINQSVSLI